MISGTRFGDKERRLESWLPAFRCVRWPGVRTRPSNTEKTPEVYLRFTYWHLEDVSDFPDITLFDEDGCVPERFELHAVARSFRSSPDHQDRGVLGYGRSLTVRQRDA